MALLDEKAAGGRPAGAANCVESVTHKLDETARILKGTDAFLDPRAWRKQTAAFGLPSLDLPVEYGGSAWPATR